MFRLIKKDSGEGVVCAVGKDRIFIASPKGHVSNNCGGGKECGRGCGGCFPLVSAPEGYNTGGEICIPVKNPARFNIGDCVYYERSIPEPNLMSVLVFGIPVVFALAAMAYLHVTTAHRAATSPTDFIIVVTAFLGGFAIVGMLDYLFKKRYPPSINIHTHPSDNTDMNIREACR